MCYNKKAFLESFLIFLNKYITNIKAEVYDC